MENIDEKREVTRIEYNVQGVIVVIDTEEKFVVRVENVSPLGMGVLVKKEATELIDKDIIIVADCMVMYATVTRVAYYDEEYNIIGLKGKSFDLETLNYLFEHIG